MSSGEDKRGECGGGQGTCNGVSSLFDIDFSVPSSPGFEGCEHSTLATHVSECGLSSSVGTTSGYSRNSGHGSSGSPGFSCVFLSSSSVDSMSLSSVLAQVGVYEREHVLTDRGFEYSW